MTVLLLSGDAVLLGALLDTEYNAPNAVAPRVVAVVMFFMLATLLAIVGGRTHSSTDV